MRSFSKFVFAAAVLSASASPTSDLDKRAKTCAQCPTSIVYSGLTRNLVLIRQSSVPTLNTVQCDYEQIGSILPYCLFNNFDGTLFITNTGGSCPAVVPVTTGTVCPSTF